MDVQESKLSAGEQELFLRLCQDLVSCINKIMDPSSSQEERAICSQRVEEFKDQSPYCLRCSFLLAKEEVPVIKHFGLQLMEHFVKYRWESLQNSDRQQFQLSLLRFISEKLLPHGQEMTFVKEALARVTVETAKRMWPQQWDSFFADMDTLSKCGTAQVELVLLIFRRLAEDIHLFHSGITPRRKREMAASLNKQAGTVLGFLVNNLEFPLSDHLRIVSLSTAASFVEWVEFGAILMDDARLIKLLYTFIGVEDLKTMACECLVLIVSRKGDVKRTEEDRTKIISLLLSTEALNGIMTASIEANSAGTVDEQYVFLKRVCQLLVHLGTSQLAPLWLHSSSFKSPDTLVLYLQVLAEFTKHDSQLLCLTSADVWVCFLSHNHIREDPVFKDFLPQLLRIAKEKLLKVGDPTLTNHISSEYARLDFDGVDEFTLFFSTFRNRMTKIVSQIATFIPRTAASDALLVTEQLVQKMANSGKDTRECTKSSMSYIEWDGLMCYLECWTGTFKIDQDLLSIPFVVEKSLAVIRQLLAYETADPLILLVQFKCLQTGLVVIDRDQSVFQSFLLKIFSSVGFLGGEGDKYEISKDVITTRNSITTAFVRLCDAHPSLLAPYVEQLYLENYLPLVKNDKLVYAEKCNFIESFLLLSHKKHSAQEQAAFLGEVLQETKSLLQEMEHAASSTGKLVAYLFLDRDPADPAYQKTHRYRLCFVVHTVSLVLKRSLPVADGGDPQNHPTYSHILPFLVRVILPLTRSIYQLWSDNSKQLLSEHFRKLSELHQFERDTILGRNVLRRSDSEDYGEVGHVQMNLAAAHEGCVSCISRAFAVYSCEHLFHLGLLSSSLEAVLSGISNLNFFRLRVLIRHLLLPLVRTCIHSKDSWETVLIPFLSQSCFVMFSQLKTSWELIAQRQASVTNASDVEQEENTESKEILQEQATILLSREYCHLLEEVCVKRLYGSRRGKSKLNGEGMASSESDMADSIMAESLVPVEGSVDQWSSVESLTPFGDRLLQIPDMCELLFMSSFCGLVWSDSHCSNKCISLAGVLFEKVPVGYFPNQVYEQFFTQVLLALHSHGIYDHVKVQLSFLAMLIYEASISCCPNIKQILLQVPDVEQSKLESFNELMRNDPPPSLKLKKETFRALLSGAVGRPIAEVFRRSVTFNLPEMQFKKKSKQIVSETDIPNLSALFGETSNS